MLTPAVVIAHAGGVLGTFKKPQIKMRPMTNGWIEPRTKIPFVGIIAMVAVVAVVAIFIRTQIAPLFPPSDVSVQASSQNIAGHASASYLGLREVPLYAKTYLRGVLNTPKQGITFTLDTSRKLLVIAADNREEVELQTHGDLLAATFEYNGAQTVVQVDPVSGVLKISSPGVSVGATQVNLAEYTVYEGLFTMRSKQYAIDFSSAGSYATIGTDIIQLTQDGAMYRGSWSESGKTHPVTINAESQEATIEDIY
jgi:hypothetical protein